MVSQPMLCGFWIHENQLLTHPRGRCSDLEWKVLYVGSAHDSHQDQVLDEILVGPVPVGRNKFVLQADAPDVEKLPKDQLLGVTVVLVTCRYKEREFVRVGYYVNNEYTAEGYDPESGPPSWPFDLSLVTRHILADKPRVTKFAIPWDSSDEQMDTVDHAANEPTNAMMQEKDITVGPGTPSTVEMEAE